jgi:hypothetical protein
MKTTILAAAFCLAAGAAHAQDKKKTDEPGAVLKEVDQRLKAQGDEILRAVQKMLDDRLGKAAKPEPRKEPPKKEAPEARGDEREKLLREVDKRLKAQRDELIRAVEKLLDARLGKEDYRPGKKGPGTHAQDLPPGLARKFALQRGKPGPGDKRGKKKGEKDDE